MVSDTGRAADPRRIRRLKLPQALEVETNAAGIPRRLRLGNAWHEVTLARRPWRIDQHWWREQPVRRTYYRLALVEGPPLTVYYDHVAKAWARQEY